MSKQLLIMRHAKAERDPERWQDFDRPLNERGTRDAPAMGRWLRRQKIHIDHILSSPAERTKATAKKVAKELEYDGTIETPEALYEGSASEYVRQIRLCPTSVEVLLLVGHNPALEQLVERLCGEFLELKTSAIAWLQFRGSDWEEVKPDSLELVDSFSPKSISQS